MPNNIGTTIRIPTYKMRVANKDSTQEYECIIDADVLRGKMNFPKQMKLQEAGEKNFFVFVERDSLRTGFCYCSLLYGGASESSELHIRVNAVGNDDGCVAAELAKNVAKKMTGAKIPEDRVTVTFVAEECTKNASCVKEKIVDYVSHGNGDAEKALKKYTVDCADGTVTIKKGKEAG